MLSSFADGSFGLFTIALAQTLILAGAAVAWQGIRAFDHRRLDLKLAAAGPLAFLLLATSAPLLQASFGARYFLAAVIGAIYTGLAAWELKSSEHEEQLSNRPFAYVWFAALTLVLMVSGLSASLSPVTPVDLAQSVPLWLSIAAFAIFLHAFIAPLSVFLMLRDRLLVEHRWSAATDALTGLANRFTFLDMLQTLSTKVRGEGAFLYVDVDHVKRINDHYGHSGGDQVLKTCAELILRELPEHALLGRLAGAEFAAYVPFCKVEEAEKLAHIIHDSVEQQMFFLGGELVPVTVSVGVAHGAMQVTADELLKRADAALYTAKVNGRNSVVVWSDGQRPSYA
ncbi:GGDEF domain-containing protein [Rhizobium sp. AQ_MP]|uniref:GGDEF domain-containing protein n=1 Tax=Rhizobium sp. AQ_MP TaxID=2761536 RepID=UPI00163B0E99|nr:GGDEF domain-containing protein [Rhizobium sp. AQ_MP]MBC2773334.1 GGDEF domain-containing protein [Rhizobium sp. AQ_MP]